MPGDVTPIEVAAALLLVVVTVALSAWQRLGLGSSVAWASIRALLQLLAIGSGLVFVVRPDSPIALSWLWVMAMVGFAAETTARRVPEFPAIRWLALTSFAAAGVVTLGIIFGLGIFPVEGRTVVPLAGMMIGNAMTATILVARRLVAEFGDKRSEVEARLALGQSSRQAARPYLREALRTALIPQIETTKAVGIVFLPGAMTGLILAGVDPIDAVLVQVVVMYLVLGAAATTTVIIALGVRRHVFTPDHRLVPLQPDVERANRSS